ncbi:MAG TPA: hypothetical protein VFX65_05525 [Candidatus Limnocylindrales bacterium]|nr:hypothetical protein [Candidatus Limnocylindrales bacterium]
MTATALRAVDPAIDEIRDRLPDLSQLDLPSLEALGRRADEAVDRLRGRSRRPAWPWIIVGIGLVGLVAAVTAGVLATWGRNHRTDPWPDDALDGLDRIGEPGAGTGIRTGDDFGSTSSTAGLSAAEASLLSYDPVENRGA